MLVPFSIIAGFVGLKEVHNLLICRHFRITCLESRNEVVESRMEASDIVLNLLEGKFVKVGVCIAHCFTRGALRFLRDVDKQLGPVLMEI